MVASDAELIGGPEKRRIVIVDPDPAWPERFRRHAETITAVLGQRALRVEHIGSTSVPDLPAKPIIDVLLVVADPSQEDTYLPQLEAAGYRLRVREPSFDQHRMLRTPELDVHLHVFPPSSPEVRRCLALRDLLRQESAARRLYGDTKRRLAEQDWPTMDSYAAAKSTVIEQLIARATGTA